MEGNILVVYYSYSGNTGSLAKVIAKKSRGTLIEIIPQLPYPSEYHAVVEQAKIELKEGYHPIIKAKINQMEDYSAIFIGTPNWCSTVAPPMQTFLHNYDFTGKTIIPFCTHGGGGAGYIEKTIKRLCPKAHVLTIFASYDNSIKESDLDKWLQKSGLVIPNRI